MTRLYNHVDDMLWDFVLSNSKVQEMEYGVLTSVKAEGKSTCDDTRQITWAIPSDGATVHKTIIKAEDSFHIHPTVLTIDG
jgi:hypothetical protein